MSDLCFIVNPVSGSGNGMRTWNAVEGRLKELNCSYKAHILQKKGDAARLAASFVPGSPCTLVVIGGDGTINEVLGSLLDFSNITFACIPSGSGNDFIRGLGFSRDPLKALEHILNPTQILDMDLGEISFYNGDQPVSRRFAVSAGIGYDAAVCEAIQTSCIRDFLNRFHAGKVAYLLIALSQLLTMKRRTLKIETADGYKKIFEHSYFAAAMNLPYEGGGFKFCPDADPLDGTLDLLLAHHISRPRVLFLLPLALFGKHTGHRGIELIRSNSIKITASHPLCVHTDGEIPGYTKEIEFRILPQSYRLIRC